MSERLRARMLFVSMLSIVVLTVAMVVPVEAANGHILPANAKVAGWSLTDAARATAYFNTSFNPETNVRDEGRYPPNLPFQMLYVTESNRFEAKAGTTFYVPIVLIDTSPDVLGTYPATNAEARKYFFDREQFGIRDVQVIIDGKTVAVGPEYLAGPVTTKLGYSYVEPDADYQYAVVGVFLKLQKGEHTVTIHNIAEGQLLKDYFAAQEPPWPWAPIESTISYTVVVR